MAAEDITAFPPQEEEQIPDRIVRTSGGKTIVYFTKGTFKFITSTPGHTPVMRIESPNDPIYRRFLEEAGPDGVVHHPV